MTENGSVEFNPFDPKFRADPYATYRGLRDEDPVHRTPFGMLALSRYRDCVALLRHPSASSDVRNSTSYQRQLSEGGSPQRVFGEVGGLRPFLFMDPPDHTRLRRLVQKAFTPRTVDALRPHIESLVDELLAPFVESGSIEVIEDLAYPLPLYVICELIGVPAEDQVRFKVWSRQFARAHDPTFTISDDELELQDQAANDFVDYFRNLIADRRRQPSDDLLTGLVMAEDEGHQLSEQELLSTLILLLVAGHETTANLIGNGILALCRHPEQLQRLHEEPGLARSTVEEVLRYDSPVQLTARVALDNIEIGDTTLAKGDQALLLLAAANRDADEFPDSEAFDIERRDNGHLAFSHGAHFCLGATLARVEGQVVFESLATQVTDMTLAGDKLEYKENIVLRGLDTLPVTFTACP